MVALDKRATLTVWGAVERKEELFIVNSLKQRDFPGGAVVKNPPTNAGDASSNPGLGRAHMPRSN